MKQYIINFRDDDVLVVMIVNAYCLEDAQKIAKDYGQNVDVEELRFNEDISQQVKFYIGD